ncbi:hypothetical protein ABT353_50000, partial [Nonomuraea wenchangensis]
MSRDPLQPEHAAPGGGGVFLAAMLTIIGYSINDKVVVFDRVRELWQG